MASTKWCTECRESKELAAFYRSSFTRDGRHAQCADCTRRYLGEAERNKDQSAPPEPRPAKRGKKPKQLAGETKTCYTCKELLDLSKFHRNKNSSDGRHGQCMGCKRNYMRDVRHGRRERKSRPLDDAPEGYKTCVDCDKILPLADYHKQRGGRQGVRTNCKACVRAYQDRNKERMQETAKAWKETNPDKVRAATQRRRALKNDVTAEPFIDVDVFVRDGWVCGLCSEPVNPAVRYPDPLSPSLDHVVPLSKGGHHTMDNVQLAHFHCNSSKGNRYSSLTQDGENRA